MTMTDTWWLPQPQQTQPPKTNSTLSPEEIAEFERKSREADQRAKELENQLAASKLPDAQEQAKLDRAKKAREEDLAAGRKRGEEQFGDGSLGRLSDETIANLRANAKGFTAEEQNAMRDQNLSSVNQANAGALRQQKIQQALNGVRGGQAVAQNAKMLQDQANQNAQMERDLFLKQIDARRAGQTALMDSEKYTNEQKNREKLAQITTELGYGALGAADRGAVMQAVIGEKQATAAANSGGGGGKK